MKLSPGILSNRIPRQRMLYLAGFYLGIPVALALYSGASESGSAAFVERRYHFYYFLAASLPVWLAFDVCTRCAKFLLKPWQPPLLLILVLGAIMGLHLQGLWTPWRQSFFEPYLAEGSRFYSVFPWRYSEPDYLVKAIIAWIAASAVWAGANFVFLHVFRVPRYGYGTGSVDSQGAPRATKDGTDENQREHTGAGAVARVNILLDKLPKSLGPDVVALKAEEHYTRVHTTQGEVLILMRFSDAVELVEELKGLQTHRSYWVNPRYVEELVNEGRATHLHLSTGINVPVSRTYRLKVREALAGADAQRLAKSR